MEINSIRRNNKDEFPGLKPVRNFLLIMPSGVAVGKEGPLATGRERSFLSKGETPKDMEIIWQSIVEGGRWRELIG